jgi:hypothetical protein
VMLKTKVLNCGHALSKFLTSPRFRTDHRPCGRFGHRCDAQLQISVRRKSDIDKIVNRKIGNYRKKCDGGGGWKENERERERFVKTIYSQEIRTAVRNKRSVNPR